MFYVNLFLDTSVLIASYVNFRLQFKPEEISAIVKDFEEPGTLAPTGLHLGGTKYMVIQGEPGAVIRGKKVIRIKFCVNISRDLCTLFLTEDHVIGYLICNLQGSKFFANIHALDRSLASMCFIPWALS